MEIEIKSLKYFHKIGNIPFYHPVNMRKTFGRSQHMRAHYVQIWTVGLTTQMKNGHGDPSSNSGRG